MEITADHEARIRRATEDFIKAMEIRSATNVDIIRDARLNHIMRDNLETLIRRYPGTLPPSRFLT
jgi:hypothetical protein